MISHRLCADRAKVNGLKFTPKQNPLVYLCRDGQRQRGLPTAVCYEEHQARDHRNAKALVDDNVIAVLLAQ